MISVFSGILERISHDQLFEFLQTNNTLKADLHYNHFDRRPKRSNGLRTCAEFWVIAEKSN